MKKVLILALLFSASFSVKAQQNYADSLKKYATYKDSAIDMASMLQISAIYISQFIKERGKEWPNRLAPDVLRPYVGKANKIDSVFNPPPMPAWYLTGMLEILITGASAAVEVDKAKVLDNNTSIPGYAALTTQIVGLSNGSSAYKWVAKYVLYYYLYRDQAVKNARLKFISEIVKWVEPIPGQ